jgi:hypothetical protein
MLFPGTKAWNLDRVFSLHRFSNNCQPGKSHSDHRGTASSISDTPIAVLTSLNPNQSVGSCALLNAAVRSASLWLVCREEEAGAADRDQGATSRLYL